MSTKTTLNKFLKESTKEELEKEIKKLCTRFKDVKQYYQMELSGDTTKILNEHKKKIKNEYFPSRGYGKARNSVSRKVVTDFKKISIFKKDLIELLLYRVEMMIKFTATYGDIDEPFYNSLETSFDDACILIQSEKLEKEFRVYCEKLVNSTSDFGWGVHYGLSESFEMYLK